MDRNEFIKASSLAFFGCLAAPANAGRPTLAAFTTIKEQNMKKVPLTLLTGLDIGESPRWHDGRLWFCNWIKQEVVAMDIGGKMEVILKLPFPSFPFSIDWLPNGKLIVVSNSDQPLMQRESDGSLTSVADLSTTNIKVWNEIVIDGKGNIYINGANSIVLVTATGSVRKQTDGLSFPNGMIITPDNSKLVVAESFGKKLTAFDISSDGSLLNKRVWADLNGGAPDGICLDGDGCIWYADVPNKCCVRAREGGEVVEKFALDRGGFACALGGKRRKTLFVMAAQWYGFDKINDSKGTGQVQAFNVSTKGVGYP